MICKSSPLKKALQLLATSSFRLGVCTACFSQPVSMLLNFFLNFDQSVWMNSWRCRHPPCLVVELVSSGWSGCTSAQAYPLAVNRDASQCLLSATALHGGAHTSLSAFCGQQWMSKECGVTSTLLWQLLLTWSCSLVLLQSQILCAAVTLCVKGKIWAGGFSRTPFVASCLWPMPSQTQSLFKTCLSEGDSAYTYIHTKLLLSWQEKCVDHFAYAIPTALFLVFPLWLMDTEFLFKPFHLRGLRLIPFHILLLGHACLKMVS